MTPTDTTIAPGEQFTAHLTLLGCLGTKVLSDSVAYESLDLNVAAVATVSGLVIGVRPGSTVVRATGARYRVTAETRVTVR